ncbi:DegV family protein [Macrococcoides canis]|uniref:DegV domain-containing protein n=1 Tax=Macrococcoides canis TaxID=1855823 RepID=A0A1W7AA18_9STAP|nr:DegV family protein [Macrococcus canis]ARQ06354.1 DegV domain-containing protein [Macrococcus canis]QIH75379.1 DegV family EDD domain-containing protein [Macrococcus canis]UTH00691.1 DegV family protein [Macrococcus canis]WBF52316.1 DegV family protein [Macrococcus canis]
MKTAIITDSTSYLSQEMIERYDIRIISLNVIFKDQVFVEAEYAAEQFYERMRSEKQLPTTSQPTTGEYIALLEQLKAEGYTDCIAIHLSSGISGTYQNAIAAGEMVEGINMYAFDSEIACMVAGMYTLRAAELKDTFSPEQIIEELKLIRANSKAYFLVDDLKNLQKGGRLNGAQAIIGSMLQVKPILHFEDKVIVPYDKVRTKKKAVQFVQDKIKQEVTAPATIVVIHANADDEAEAIMQHFKTHMPDVDVIKSYFGPVIGTHLGEKALGVGYVHHKFDIFQ